MFLSQQGLRHDVFVPIWEVFVYYRANYLLASKPGGGVPNNVLLESTPPYTFAKTKRQFSSGVATEVLK